MSVIAEVCILLIKLFTCISLPFVRPTSVPIFFMSQFLHVFLPPPRSKYEKSKAVLHEHRRCADRNDAATQEARGCAGREKQRYDMLQQHSEDAHTR